jgi:hypothetical protein
VFHPGTLFQNETPGNEAALPRRSFHREPLGFELKPARAMFAVNPAHFFGFAFGMPAAFRRRVKEDSNGLAGRIRVLRHGFHRAGSR